ncbi:hypothetical protein BC831DRAFT_443720 [Entophlyctis helioformis]|nr:hypothetical protein BC831DRAFT_443720 [Entophlyctis helioformis]
MAFPIPVAINTAAAAAAQSCDRAMCVSRCYTSACSNVRLDGHIGERHLLLDPLEARLLHVRLPCLAISIALLLATVPAKIFGMVVPLVVIAAGFKRWRCRRKADGRRLCAIACIKRGRLWPDRHVPNTIEHLGRNDNVEPNHGGGDICPCLSDAVFQRSRLGRGLVWKRHDVERDGRKHDGHLEEHQDDAPFEQLGGVIFAGMLALLVCLADNSTADERHEIDRLPDVVDDGQHCPAVSCKVVVLGDPDVVCLVDKHNEAHKERELADELRYQRDVAEAAHKVWGEPCGHDAKLAEHLDVGQQQDRETKVVEPRPCDSEEDVVWSVDERDAQDFKDKYDEAGAEKPS